LLRPLLLAAGVVVIAYLVSRVGVETVWESLRTLSWRLAIVVAFPYALTSAVDAVAWGFSFPRRPAPLSRLWSARVAGEAVNLVTPMASVGGEPVKALLLRRWTPLVSGLASVVVDKTTAVTGQLCFLVVGLVIASSLVPVSSPLLTAMWLFLAVEVVGIGGFVLVQLRGVAGRGGRLLKRLGLGPGPSTQAGLEGLDRTVATFYRNHPRRLGASVACHFVAWVVESLEIWLVLWFLDAPVSLSTAAAMQSFGNAVKFVSFMVPASLGALEGGNVAIFAGFGLGGATGLAYTLIRRLREIAWAAVGLLLLAALSGRPAPVHEEPPLG
jgi:putative membrane protein